jgi:hypothetical protein
MLSFQYSLLGHTFSELLLILDVPNPIDFLANLTNISFQHPSEWFEWPLDNGVLAMIAVSNNGTASVLAHVVWLDRVFGHLLSFPAL